MTDNDISVSQNNRYRYEQNIGINIGIGIGNITDMDTDTDTASTMAAGALTRQTQGQAPTRRLHIQHLQRHRLPLVPCTRHLIPPSHYYRRLCIRLYIVIGASHHPRRLHTHRLHIHRRPHNLHLHPRPLSCGLTAAKTGGTGRTELDCYLPKLIKGQPFSRL